MKPVDAHPEIRRRLKTLRIIVGALFVGVGAFLAFVLLNPQEPTAQDPPVLLYMLLGMVGLLIPVWLVLRAVHLRRARDAYDEDDVKPFCDAYGTATIILAALIEGPGFFAIVTYWLTQDPTALGIAGACLILLLMMMPTEGRVNAILEHAP